MTSDFSNERPISSNDDRTASPRPDGSSTPEFDKTFVSTFESDQSGGDEVLGDASTAPGASFDSLASTVSNEPNAERGRFESNAIGGGPTFQIDDARVPNESAISVALADSRRDSNRLAESFEPFESFESFESNVDRGSGSAIETTVAVGAPGNDVELETTRLERDATVISEEPPFGFAAFDQDGAGGGVDVGASPENGDAKGERGRALDAEDAVFPSGTRFGQFVVVKFIGGGGMGRVYEGRDPTLDRRVAIKVLPRRLARDEATVARFLNEAKSAARLNHEHIAQVYFCGRDNGVPYIAFEFVSGSNLRDYVRERGVLELGEAVDFVLQAADALAHAASHGVIHRDVKPSNIIVTPQKRVKLIDMGLARLLKTNVADDDLTESGVTLGTFDYISPEQARDPRNADARSDVYSLGCTFYYMLVGTPPFPDGTMLQKLLQHQGDDAPDVRDANPAIPVEIAAVIKKTMRKKPEERYQTAEALIADLLEIADMLGLRVAEQGASSFEEKSENAPASRLRRTPALVAIGLLGAIVAAFYWGTRGADVNPPSVRPAFEPRAAAEADGGSNNASTALGKNVPPDGSASERSARDASSSGSGSFNDSVDSAQDGRATRGVESSGETFDSASLDASSLASRGVLSLAPLVVVDDAEDWRRSYLSGGALAADSSRRFGVGWRARRPVSSDAVLTNVVDGRGEIDVKISTFLSVFDPAISRAATAYSTLGTTSERASNGSGATASALRIVDGVGGAARTFASLQAALASSNDVGVEGGRATPIRVELRFNGSLPTPPLTIAGKKIELVAAEGFRPALTFKPPETPGGGWGERMFLLDDADLSIRGVSVDFTVPAQDVVASEWSVFELLGESSLTIRDGTTTVRNATGEAFVAPLHSNVAIVRGTKKDEFEDFVASSGTRRPASLPTVRFENVFARGEATAFATNCDAGSIDVLDSGFNVAGPVFWSTATERGLAADSSGRSTDRFSLRFERVVVVGRSSFVRCDRDEAAGNAVSVSLDVAAIDSIVRLGSEPLGVLYSSRPLDEETTFDDWNLTGTLTLDVSAFWRRRLRQSAAFRDFEPSGERTNESASLNDLNADAARRLDSIAPRRFESSDFARLLTTPIRSSSSIGDAARKTIDGLRTNFGDADR